jgi:hypothetical protein
MLSLHGVLLTNHLNGTSPYSLLVNSDKRVSSNFSNSISRSFNLTNVRISLVKHEPCLSHDEYGSSHFRLLRSGDLHPKLLRMLGAPKKSPHEKRA